jgi:hypothetical protein
MARNLQPVRVNKNWGTMADKELTVSDLSQLIAAREETRAELHLLSLEAWEHWRELEAKLHELEERLCRGLDGEQRSGVHPIAGSADPPSHPNER